MAFYNLRLSFIVLYLTIILNNFQNVSTQTPSALSLQSVENSELRKGFQFVYSVANSFIDAIQIKYPSEIFSVNTSISYNEFEKRILDYFNTNDWKVYFNKAYGISPGLAIFLIFEIAFIILLPIIGLIVCMCRTCCCKNRDPYDDKNDKTKRKILAAVLFIPLIALLFIVVIIFATNSYANQAIHRTSDVVKKSSQSVRSYIDVDLLKFKNDMQNATFSFKDTIGQTFDLTQNDILKSVEDEVASSVDPVYNRVTNEYLSPIRLTADIDTTLKKPVFEQWSINCLNISATTGNTQINMTDPFNPIDIDYQDILGNFSDKNSILNYTAMEDAIKDQTNTYKDDFSSGFDSVIVTFNKTIEDTYKQVLSVEADFLNKIDSTSNDFNNKYISYYAYGYYSLLGISIFMLLVFVLLMLGCLGICCNRKHDDRRQSCHRGVSAGCITFGVTLIFLFGSLIMIVCMVLFIAGFSSRNVVCKPLIMLEDDKLFQFAKKIDIVYNNVGDISFKNLIKQCRTANTIEQVNEIDKILIKTLNFSISDIRDPKYYTKLLDDELDTVLTSINNTNIDFPVINIDTLKTFGLNKTFLDLMRDDYQTKLDEHNQQLIKVNQFLNSPAANNSAIASQVAMLRSIKEEYNATLIDLGKLVTDWYNAALNNTAVTQSINADLNKLNSVINNKTHLNDVFKTVTTRTINNVTRPELIKNINNTLATSLGSLPSCKFLSAIYDDVTVNVCYEYFDNLNGYWFALWVSLLIYVVLIGFALRYTTLLRKMYSFEQSFSDFRQSPTAKNTDRNEYNNMPLRQVNGGRRVHPIDAYTNKPGYSSETPPPTYNYKSQRL